jgi:hypothetical protein
VLVLLLTHRRGLLYQGVIIETAEERKRAQVAAAMRQADALEAEISYVLVPADTSKPLRELTFHPLPGVPGDQLLQHLKPEFCKKSGENVDLELLKEQSSQTLAGSANAPTSVSDATLQQVAGEANVEIFSLVHPIPSNNFTGINIYLDEGKKLELSMGRVCETPMSIVFCYF